MANTKINKERVFREDPFCYQDKGAFRLIRENTKSNPKLNNILRSIYVVLTERASDVGKNTFFATWSILSTYSGIGVRTFKRYASFLEKYELIEIERTKIEHPNQPNKIINKPNKFTILSTKNTPTYDGAGLAGPGGCLTGPQLEVKLLEVNSLTPLEELTPAKQPKNPHENLKQYKTPLSEKLTPPKRNNRKEWFKLPQSLKENFINKENLNLLNSTDKKIIEILPEIIEDKEKIETLLADIQIVYVFCQKQQLKNSFLKKIINLDDILDKITYKQLTKGLKIAQERRKSGSLSYLKGILWKGFRA